MILRVINRSDPLRSDVEEYIRRVFACQHAAVVREFPELLVAALGPDLSPLCAAGMRTAKDGFFAEFYLRSPVECTLSQACRMPVQRDQIIEVTSLASDRPGHAFNLIDYIVQLGRVDGRRWGVFTATEKIRRYLNRGGLAYTPLAAASADAVPNPDDWGRYYQANPVVCAMHDRRENPISFPPPRSQQTAFGGLTVMEAKPID